MLWFCRWGKGDPGVGGLAVTAGRPAQHSPLRPTLPHSACPIVGRCAQEFGSTGHRKGFCKCFVFLFSSPPRNTLRSTFTFNKYHQKLNICIHCPKNKQKTRAGIFSNVSVPVSKYTSSPGSLCCINKS